MRATGWRVWGALAGFACGVVAFPVAAQVSPLSRVADSLATAGFTGQLLVADGTTVLFDRAIGVPPNAVWRYASVTKQITAALVLREVDRGRVVLDAPVRRFLPGWPGDGAITVRHLLQHTSGLANPDDGPKDADGVPRFYRRTGAMAALLATVNGLCAANSPANAKANAAAGERFSYNNCDYLVLQAMLEAVTGQPFARLATSVVAPSTGAAVRGRLENGSPEPAINLATFGAAGALTGTARALMSFNRALLAGQLMSDSLRTISWRGEPRFGYAALGVWSFPASLRGCAADLPLVERRGEILGTQVRNILAPTLGRMLIVFTNQAAVPFGEIWQQAGLSYELLSAAFCPGR